MPHQNAFAAIGLVTSLSSFALSSCIVTNEPPPARTAACPQATACPTGSQCTAITAAPAPITAQSLGTSAAPIPKPHPFELRGTQVREMHSDLTGKDYELLIDIPESFGKEPDRRYPVLYLLDGQWDFSLVRTLSGGLRYDKVMPEMLVVGLSYGGNNPDYDALRADDYIPTRAKDFKGVEKGGGAPRFLTWLETTVIPFVEREYRADPAHRILSGSSNGGLFTLYALFERPELFESYVAISPAVNWDQRYLFGREKDFRKSHPRLERRLWLSYGSEEWPDYLQSEIAFFKQMQSNKYAGLTLKIQSIAGERHAGVKPEAYNRAMRFVSEPLMAAANSKSH